DMARVGEGHRHPRTKWGRVHRAKRIGHFAEIEEEGFELGGPIAGESRLEAGGQGKNGPGETGVRWHARCCALRIEQARAAGIDAIALKAREGDTAGDVPEPVIGGVAEATAYRGEPVELMLLGQSKRTGVHGLLGAPEQAGLVALTGPLPVGLDAQ